MGTDSLPRGRKLHADGKKEFFFCVCVETIYMVKLMEMAVSGDKVMDKSKSKEV